MQLSIISPTIFESATVINYLEQNFSLLSGVYKKNDLCISASVCGVGLVNTAIHTTKLMMKDTDLMILMGLGGAFNRDLKLGEVVNVTEETFGDLGAEQQDGSIHSTFDLKLMNANQYPFTDGKIINLGAKEHTFLPHATSISVNKVSGSQNSIDRIQNKYPVDIENMEGAAFFQVCKLYRRKFLEIRAISNYVEPRNRDAWEIELALKNLSEVVISIIEGLEN